MQGRAQAGVQQHHCALSMSAHAAEKPPVSPYNGTFDELLRLCLCFTQAMSTFMTPRETWESLLYTTSSESAFCCFSAFCFKPIFLFASLGIVALLTYDFVVTDCISK